MAGLLSAKPLLALLHDRDPSVVEFALNRLERCVDDLWFEVNPELPTLTELSESRSLTDEQRQRAALIASHVLFHTNKMSDAVHMALNAGKLLSVAQRSEYADTMLGTCVDLYVAERDRLARQDALADDLEGSMSVATPNTPGTQGSFEGLDKLDTSIGADPRLSVVFEQLANSWQQADSLFSAKEVVGFIVRARRKDLLTSFLARHVEATKSMGAVNFALTAAMKHVADIRLRKEILRSLAEQYARARDGGSNVDASGAVFSQAQCLLYLEDSAALAGLIVALLKGSQAAEAVQLAFDLAEGASQETLAQIVKHAEEQLASDATAASSRAQDVLNILRGAVTTDLYLKFLFTRCNADISTFNRIRRFVPRRGANCSALHTALFLSGALMHAGTAHDGFMRDNMNLLSKTTDWAKFAACACLGVVHRGHTSEIREILKPYLPSGRTVDALPYHQAGAMYGLGLAVGGTGATKETAEAVTYLREALQNFSASEQMVHGASLGVGLAALGLRNEALAEQLFACVNACDAVGGEGAALAMGLVMLGAAPMHLIETMLRAARVLNQKEKTIRGLCMGVALMLLRRESLALGVITDMARDRDPWIRVGACFVIGLAYAGTNSNAAVEKLLDLCVRDAHDEVRRVAVMMIGFVTLTDPVRCRSMVRAFADSYNPHVRYGVALALGVAGAGSADAGIVRLLRRLTVDANSFVRQGANLALSLVLVQSTEAQVPFVREFRTGLINTLSDAKADICNKFGAIVGMGLIDAGGRNCTVALHRNGLVSQRAVVGAFMFSQHWFWFPYMHAITLAFQPTCVVGLNDALKMPEFALVSNAAPGTFAPPATYQAEKAKEQAKGTHKMATLSTSAKEASRKKKKAAAAGADAAAAAPAAEDKAAKDKAAGDAKDKDAAAAAPEKKATTETIQNPARVTRAQLAVLQPVENQRYELLRPMTLGINVLVDRHPEQGEDTKVVNVDFSQTSDVKPPEPFSWP